MKQKKKLHMIGNAHIDPVWLWNWQEGFHEVKATFRSALDRMLEYPDFIFVSSSAAFFDWVEQNDPGMFAEIRTRIQQGRWRIVGGWWIEPDCNIPSGESFARQALYAQRFFKSRFGEVTHVGYAPDSFGHNGNLPQLLKLGGMTSYIFMRPSPHEKGLPGRLFWWEGDDGSRVLTYQVPYEYCTPPSDIEPHIRRVASELTPSLNDLMCFYGVGNHGGGPTRENLDAIARLQSDEGLPELRLSSPQDYFDSIIKQALSLPVVHGDLQHHASGCYAVHSGIKRWNRQAEHALIAAEKFCSVASSQAVQAYPMDFEHAWRNVLFNQFHDIMAGTSLESAYDDARISLDEALSIAQRNQNLALQALSWAVKIESEPGSIPFIVFNPNTWETCSAVELELGGWKAGMLLLDPAGQQVPYQLIQAHATSNGRTRICFTASLPALGYSVFVLSPGKPTAAGAGGQDSESILENDALRLEIDPQTGWIRSLWDKRLQVEVFAEPAARPVVLDDPSDTWSHNVFSFDHPIGEFKALSVRRVENGPVRSVVRVKSAYGQSHLIQDFILYKELDHIEVRVACDWHEQFKMLKLRFPVHLNQMKATYEIPYGHIQRAADGNEEAGQAWIDLSGISRTNGSMYGVSILNDAKYSYDVQIRDVGLTVLRSPIYAHHMPKIPEPGCVYAFIDQGMQHFTYMIYPHAGNWSNAKTVRKAWELNQKPTTLLATYHPGKLPLKNSFVSSTADQILIPVVKQAEDRNGWVVRAYETSGRGCQAALAIFGRLHTVEFKPNEIKTWLFPFDIDQEVVELNFLEERI